LAFSSILSLSAACEEDHDDRSNGRAQRDERHLPAQPTPRSGHVGETLERHPALDMQNLTVSASIGPSHAMAMQPSGIAHHCESARNWQS
jgi:hypothetical protein